MKRDSAGIPFHNPNRIPIALSTEPINREKATKSIKALYRLSGKRSPKIVFFNDPNLAFSASRQALEIAQYLKTRRETLWKIFQDLLVFPPFGLIDYFICFILVDLIINLITSFFNWNFLAELDEKSLMVLFQVPTILWSLTITLKLGSLHRVSKYIYNKFFRLVDTAWLNELVDQYGNRLNNKLVKELSKEFNFSRQFPGGISVFYRYSFPFENYLLRISLLDFCISVIVPKLQSSYWKTLCSVVQECSWIVPLDEICYVCDRPRILNLDSENRLHGEGVPAIQFADGYSVYVYHGVTLPEKYGKIHPHQWQPQWLLEEQNTELRRVLIQGIGYAKICQELQAIELDSWQEYTLLEINADADIEPIVLIKMTCPSTGYTHVLRVPPWMTSAREAIAWVNWGIDPKDFFIQT